MTGNLPFVLQTAISLIPAFVLSLKYARPGAIRAMRPERRNSLVKVLEVLLLHCSLQHAGAFCAINRVWVRPLTIEEIAKLAGLTFANVVRCLADLRRMGFIVGKQYKRRNPTTGRLEVSPGVRCFHSKFWEALGLNTKFEKSCRWVRDNCKRHFILPFKVIVAKVNGSAVKSGDAAIQLLRNMFSQHK